MEETKKIDSGLNINPQEVIANIEELVRENKGEIKSDKKGLKRVSKKNRTVKRLKSKELALFDTNKNKLSSPEIVFMSSVDATGVKLKEELLKTDDKQLKEFTRNFFVKVTPSNSDTNHVHPYYDQCGDNHPLDDVYVYDPRYFDALTTYTSTYNASDTLFFYQGNIYLNGQCYGSYTGHLENAGKIKSLEKLIEEQNTTISYLTTRLEQLENKSYSAIYRSELDTNNQNLSYIWVGDEDIYSSIPAKDKLNTIFITGEE